jgi:integrase
MPYQRIDLPSGRSTFKAFWRENGVQRSKNFATERQARLFAAQMTDRVERMGVSDPDRLTCAEFFERFIDGLKARDELAIATLVSYEKTLHRWASLFGKKLPLASLSVSHIEDGMTAMLKGSADQKPLSARSVRLARTVLGTALQAAKRRKLRVDNPAMDSEAPKSTTGVSRRSKAFTEEEVVRLLVAARSDSGARLFHGVECAVIVLLSTGLRRGEFLGLKWTDLDTEAGTLRISRTVVTKANGAPLVREGGAKTFGSLRTLALSPVTLEALRKHRISQSELALKLGREFDRSFGLIFPEWTGRPMWPATITARFVRLNRMAGIKGRPALHAFRHTHATSLLGKGVDVATIAERLGHSSPATTLSFYSHSDDTKDRAAAAKMDEFLLAALDR